LTAYGPGHVADDQFNYNEAHQVINRDRDAGHGQTVIASG